MEEYELDLWFHQIDLKGLMKIFRSNSGQDANDFIDDCDEYWDNLSYSEKFDFYLRNSIYAS